MSKKIIQAGGGVVINSRGEILMIFRRGYWDLPKGKLEVGESIEQCALREVQEECGVLDLVLGEFICVTTHYYVENGVQIEKRSHWYLMRGGGVPVPQREEDIEVAKWVSRDELPALLELAYPSIRDVFNKLPINDLE